MSLRRIEGPTLPFPLSLVKDQARVEGSAEDTLIEVHALAALAFCERYCGRAFSVQTLEVVLDAFPEAEIELPFGPLGAVVSIRYDDPAGAEQTVDPVDYRVDDASRDAWVIPLASVAWPATLDAANAVRVRYTTRADLDADVQLKVIALAASYYDNREAAGAAPLDVLDVLARHRRFFL